MVRVRAVRTVLMIQLHPDKNRDDPDAEEKVSHHMLIGE
jgi:DnaJ-class molecular chaperone